MEENGSARPQRPSGGEAGETPVGSRVATQAGLSGDTGDVGRKCGWHGGGTQPVPQEGMLSGGKQGQGVPTIILRNVVGHEERKIARGDLKVRGVTPNPHLQTASSQELLMHILNCKRVLYSGHAVCSF